jgi:glycolate oxidase FAD binding subunit
VALPDGSLARSGSKVIKNVAGYDLAKLMSGAFGTLGLIVEASVRLHPRPAATVTAVGRGEDPLTLCKAASDLAHRPVEAECLDLRWEDGAGAVLVRLAGPAAGARTDGVLATMREAGLEPELATDDDGVWEAQRAAQRGAAVVRVSATQDRLPAVLEAARRQEAQVVARVAWGLAWVSLPDAHADVLGPAIAQLRQELEPSPTVVLDAPAAVIAALDPWGPVDEPRLELMRRVKARFDPGATCNPGIFAGGI